MLVSIDRENDLSLQEQIFTAVRDRILSGEMPAGMRVLSSRILAGQLAVSRNSVVFAYERLINEGYLVTRPMVGTFVADALPETRMSATLPEPAPTGGARRAAPTVAGRQHALLNTSNVPIDFWTQRTDPRAFPLKAWRRLILGSLASAGHSLTEYGDPCGLFPLRAAIADHVRQARGIQARPEQVIIVAGAQLGLNLGLRVLARPGDEVVVENPCNQGAAYLFESLGMKLHPVPVDAHGVNPAQFPDTARLAYLTPSHQFPMGPTLSPARRKAVLDWTERTGGYVIEDDYDSEFRYDSSPVPALKAMSPDSVIYLATFSKSLGAGLRTGFAIFPEHLAGAAKTAKALLDNGQVWLEQAALAQFISSGGYVRHLRRLRQHYARRRDALVARLRQRFGSVELWGAEAGTHLAWGLRGDLPRAHHVQAIARSRNIAVYGVQSGGGHDYGGIDYDPNWLLLGYAALTESQITAGVDRLADSLL